MRDALIARAAARPDGVLGFQDETWWTRLAQPDLCAWAGPEPLRLWPNERGGGPEALACYGLRRADTGAMRLRFVDGRPVSQVTADDLAWRCEQFAAAGQRGFVLAWDNAAWHVSKRVRRWIGAHNRKVKRAGGCKIRVCSLPVQAPWLNPIEPKGRHGKRAIAEPTRKRAPEESKQRVHEHYHGTPCEPLKQITKNAACSCTRDAPEAAASRERQCPCKGNYGGPPGGAVIPLARSGGGFSFPGKGPLSGGSEGVEEGEA